jgi:hypothetical protein
VLFFLHRLLTVNKSPFFLGWVSGCISKCIAVWIEEDFLQWVFHSRACVHDGYNVICHQVLVEGRCTGHVSSA